MVKTKARFWFTRVFLVLVVGLCALVVACPHHTKDKSEPKPAPSGESSPPEPSEQEETIPGMIKLKLKGVSFRMGSTDSLAGGDESPVYEVTFAQDIYIGETEVTQAEFEAVMGVNPSNFQGDGENKKVAAGEVQERRPVEKVNWYMAIAYCNKRSLAEGLEPCYVVAGIDFAALNYDDIPVGAPYGENKWDAATCDFSKTGYRLPTESEWEYAARGGLETTDTALWAGTTDRSQLTNYAWFWYGGNGNSDKRTHEVKKRLPNAYGLYDMSGNVWEWCWDWYAAYPPEAQTAPTGPKTGTQRIVRGGCAIYNDEKALRVTKRSCYSPYSCFSETGFRLVRTSK